MSDRPVARNRNFNHKSASIVCSHCSTAGNEQTLARGRCVECRKPTCAGCRKAGELDDVHWKCRRVEWAPNVTFAYVDEPPKPAGSEGDNSKGDNK